MGATETFEEEVSQSLNALLDGARLLTGAPETAEALVVSVAVSGSRQYRRIKPTGDFGKWIIGRMVRQYLDYLDETNGWPEEGSGLAPEVFGPAAVTSESDMDAMLHDMTTWEVNSPDEFGRLIRAEMRELGLIERTAVWLVNVADFTYAEAAGVLDLGKIELRGTLLRARRELQARLAIALQGELPGSSLRGRTIGRRA